MRRFFDRLFFWSRSARARNAARAPLEAQRRQQAHYREVTRSDADGRDTTHRP